MHRSKIYTGILLGLYIFSSCVEEFDLGNIYDHEGNVAVSGWVTDLPGKQVINLSLSTPLSMRIKNPLTNCLVEVHDNEGNVFKYDETVAGKYVRIFEEGEVRTDNSYKLIFVTPEGMRYESEYERILPVPPVGELRYEQELMDTREIGVKTRGLRFYIDIDAGADYTEYFKVDIIETYKFHTYTQDVYWFHNGVISEIPPDSVRPECYITKKASGIFLAGTKNLAEKKLPDFPLHFVSNQTQRLLHGYSPEVRLMSLSAAAHNYWDNQRSILEESGGLFEIQPPVVSGNIYNTDNPEEKVLGYFGASSVTTTRIFIHKGTMEDFDIEPYCEPAIIPSFGLQRLYRMGQGVRYFTYAYTPEGAWTLHYISRDCFDCTVFDGSTIEKPEFWEQ